MIYRKRPGQRQGCSQRGMRRCPAAGSCKQYGHRFSPVHSHPSPGQANKQTAAIQKTCEQNSAHSRPSAQSRPLQKRSQHPNLRNRRRHSPLQRPHRPPMQDPSNYLRPGIRRSIAIIARPKSERSACCRKPNPAREGFAVALQGRLPRANAPNPPRRSHGFLRNYQRFPHRNRWSAWTAEGLSTRLAPHLARLPPLRRVPILQRALLRSRKIRLNLICAYSLPLTQFSGALGQHVDEAIDVFDGVIREEAHA